MLFPRGAAEEEGGMADRRAFARVLRELQEGEPAPWDPSESLSRMVDAAAAVLGVDGAVLALRDEHGPRNWVAASDAAGELLAQVQDDFGEGPSLAAHTGGEPVAVADLGADPRWARVGAVVGQLSVRSVLSVPVADQAAALGTLDLYRRDRHAWTEAEIARAGELAGVATGLLRVAEERSSLAVRVAHLERALARRDQAASAGQQAPAVADRLARLQTLIEELSRAASARRVARLVVDQGVRALAASAGLVGLVGRQGEVELVAWTGYAAGEVDPWRRLPLDARVPLVEAAREGTAIWLPSRAELETSYPGLAVPAGHQAHAAVGLAAGGRSFGVLALSFAAPQAFPEEDRHFVLALAGHCAQALKRVRLLEEARANRASLTAAQRRAITAERRAVAAQRQALAARRHAAWLAEASALLAGSIGDEVLDELAWLAVPRLADWCYVALVQRDGAIARRPAAFADRRDGQRLAALHQRPVDPASAHPVAVAVRSGQPQRHQAPDRAGRRAAGTAPDRQARRLLGLLDGGSAVVMPLQGKAGVLGAIVFGSHRPGRYGQGDMEIIEQFAARTGIAIERMRRPSAIPAGEAVDGGSQQRA
jgi:GAF domain-containing protein